VSEPALLEVRSLGKRFGGFTALESIDLHVTAGERLGLIGPNGSGKSTLVNCICGALRNETGVRSESTGHGGYRQVVIYPAGMASLPEAPPPPYAGGGRSREHSRPRTQSRGRS